MAMGPLADETGRGGGIPAADGIEKQVGKLLPRRWQGHGGGFR